ncbi:MAG TPA: ABC transporter ATP-binding protein [Streptosporangiaceae bacterium]|nr:ABC transporter ATP-binding protein [Streptosporangiaceae bacterium]
MRLDAVSKRYGWGQPWVIKDVSLDIGPGELVRLEGKNGTGKSTLLRMIAGVSAPTKGTVTGRPVTGFVPERFPPGLPFTARDYLHHLGRIQGLDAKQLPARVDACLERLGGLEFATVPMRNMSKGMCQKVAVAQALLPESGMLVLDEAWTGLDVDARAALDEVVAERLAEGGSVVFVDHDPRRLEHLEANRWRIEQSQAVRAMSTPEASPAQATRAASTASAPAPASRLAPAAGLAPTAALAAAAPPATRTPPAPPSTPMIIYVVGCPPERLETLPGVLSATAEGDGVTLRVESDASDAVLRAVLSAGDDVHIRQVRRDGRVGREGDER